MPVWGIVLLVILAILLIAFIALVIVGNKLRKKQDAQQEQIEAAKQVLSMLVIDKKKMKLKDAGLPKMVVEQTPKYLRGSKMPFVKAKIGPRIMTLMAEPKVFEQIPVKAEIKAEVSGIYITGIKSVRGGKIVVEEKPQKGLKKFFNRSKKNDAGSKNTSGSAKTSNQKSTGTKNSNTKNTKNGDLKNVNNTSTRNEKKKK